MNVNDAVIPNEDNHEDVVASFFESLDAEEAPEASVADSEPPAGDPTAQEVGDDPEAPEDLQESEEDLDDEDEPSTEGSSEESDPELDPVEKRFRHLQSLHDRQLNEVRSQLEAMNQWAQQVHQAQMAQHQAQVAQQQQVQQVNPYAHVTDEQIAAGVEGDLVNTFRTIVQHRPDKVAKTIAMAREKYGHEAGDEMQVEYNQYLVRQQAEQQRQMWEAQQSQQEEAAAPAQIRDTMNGIIANVADQYGEAFTAVQPEFIARVQENAPAFRQYMDANGYEMTPDAVHHFLVSTFNDIREQKLNETASKPRRPKKVSAQQHVESSTNSQGNNPEDMSADQLAINEILAGASHLDISHTAPTR